MNFLAHFHLAWPDPGLVAGGLEGDYYKGPIGDDLSAHVARGVNLHRAIDAYTDSHPIVAELRQHFPPELRRYAGILIDLSFDHYLSNHFEQFSEVTLTTFAEQVYGTLKSEEANLSSAALGMSGRLLEFDILNRYRDWQMVSLSAAQIGKRFKRGNPLTNIDTQLIPLKDPIETAFLAFYPLLLSFAKQYQATPSPPQPG